MLMLLMAFDKVTNPALAHKLTTNAQTAFSVGFGFNAFSCSICGRTFTSQDHMFCGHIDRTKLTYVDPSGNLAFKYCMNPVGFECSVVENPAFSVATNSKIISL